MPEWPSTTTMSESRAITLILNVLGLYALFLSWSLLQERINTKPYSDESGMNPVLFKAPLIINAVQALFASIVGLCYSVLSHGQNPFKVLMNPEPNLGSRWRTLRPFLIIAVTSSISSPLAYQSLKHVDYLAFLLAKSCKLLPVMLVHLLLYRTKFPPHKYTVAGLVTGGVILFTLAKGASKKASASDGNVLLGMSQLLGSMLLDGFTNSTQDQMFKSKQKLTGASLMCILNAIVCVLTFGYLAIFAYKSELLYSVAFVKTYPRALIDTLSFAMLGAVGQVFVFVILEKFDSLILVTATVTRKMISMILSVVLFGHHLMPLQWVGVLMVFAGIGYESAAKMSQKTKPKKD